MVGAEGDSNDVRVVRDHADARYEHPGNVRRRSCLCAKLVRVHRRAGASDHDRRPAHFDRGHSGARDRE